MAGPFLDAVKVGVGGGVVVVLFEIGEIVEEEEVWR